MKTFAIVNMTLLAACAGSAADLPRSSPEAQGVSTPAVLAFVEAADKNIDSLHSFMLIRHGKVVAEGWWTPYAPETRHSLFSLSKSFTSTAVGLAVADGKLNADDPVLKFFPDESPAEPSANLKSMRLTDLLRMSTGHQTEPPRKPNESWAKTFLGHPVPFKPGSHFQYNTPATYMLSAAVQKATGQTILDYLKPRLFDPLGIENPTWEKSPQGISVGGYGLSVRTEDIAKFGQLYLQKGKWHDKQLVPEAWVEAATARQTSNGSNPASDWDQGYGYQFWRGRHGVYRGDGAFGQYCIVMPEQDAVIAITSGVRDMQSVLNLVYDKLLPGLKPNALPSNEEARAKLESTLKGLTLKTIGTKGTPPNLVGRTFKFSTNPGKLESLTLESDDKGFTIDAKVAGAERRIASAPGAWKKGRAAWGRMAEEPAAATGAWTADDTFTAKVCFVETPFIATIRLKFTATDVSCETEWNVGFGQTKEAALVGKAE